MKSSIKEIEAKGLKSELEISDELRKLVPENENDLSFELKAELMAFGFVENYSNKESGWGTYFGPMAVWPDENGNMLETPSIKLVDKERMDYWISRIHETTNPLMKARYAGLIWDFSKPILNQRPDYEIGFAYIESLIEVVNQRLSKYPHSLKVKIDRALQLACTLNSKEQIEKAKNAILELEADFGDINKAGLWGFSFDLLVGNKNVELSAEEETSIIDTLEYRFAALTSTESLNPWNAEYAATRLAEYYRKKGYKEKVKDIILKLGEAYKLKEKDSRPMQIDAWLQKIHNIYVTYGLKEEAEAVLVRIRENGARIKDELKPITTTFEVSKEEIEEGIRQIIEGDKKELFYKIVINFTPQKEEIKSLLYEVAKDNPLTYMLPKSIHDNKGRVIAKVGSLENDLEGNIIHQISQSLSFQAFILRQIFQRLIDTNEISVEELINFIEKSPVFEKSRLDIIRLGLNAFFENNLIVTIHLLIPQIEEAFRNLIELLGGVVLKVPKGGGFQVKTFDDILRDELLKNFFGEDTQTYLRILLTDSRGWNLRNDVCHGLKEVNSFSYQAADRLIHVLLLLGLISKTEDKPDA